MFKTYSHINSAGCAGIATLPTNLSEDTCMAACMLHKNQTARLGFPGVTKKITADKKSF